MTDRQIDLLVIKTICEITKHIRFDEEHEMLIAQPALDALRAAFLNIRETTR